MPNRPGYFGELGLETLGNWLRKNASTIIILLAIFSLALFLRAYFPLEEAIQDHLLSGGSDSFYYEHIIEHIVKEKRHLDWDPLLNYPMGLGNPRPPIFSWFVALPGMILSPLSGNVWQSVVTVLILSTAIWGALTIFPTYFLTKNIFGRRAGLIAAFLLAIMPAHLQRSVATNADHDSMVLFFVVTCFYFFMKALKLLKERRWVASWDIRSKDGRSSIIKGLREFLNENRKALLYSIMAGLAMATVALIWQGWAYVPIILLVYIVVQLFAHRLRDRDPMGLGICFTITMIVAFILASPWYILYGQTKTWFDVPFILFMVAIALGSVLTVTRNYPWVLVVPAILIAGGIVLGALVITNPTVAAAFVSGAGYFVRTKLYETIAEAQAPGFSQAILSFGAATYYLSLFGLLWMAVKFSKRQQPDYLFVLTWSFAAIFMSMAAARFIFNASPAFAVTAGWIIVLVFEWLDFDSMKKTFSSLVGGSKLVAIRKSVRPKHVIGALIAIFILLLPNVWYGVDAAIPYEQKAEYDRQVYYTIPDFARPQGYSPPTGMGGTTFYFGAFGYSLPLTSTYFPAAWDWLADQDSNLSSVSKPAYLSWWDYGFEAIDRGDHPTVADNFQDGYQLAGQFITTQTEDNAIALFILRLIDGDYYLNKGHLSTDVSNVLNRWGADSIKIENSYRYQASLVSVVLNDPIRYGRWDANMQSMNALYIYLSEYLDSLLTTDELASLYHDIRDVTGWSIRYFGVDSRMFPFDGAGNNIFYAPVKLSDHRVENMPDGRVLPIDYFSIEAQTDKGTFPAQLVPLGTQINSLDIKYTDMFYDSMFYRAYMGFSPEDVGQTCASLDCLPGIRGEIQSMNPMQAWGLSHFKVVYKTSYYNPWPISDYANHSEDWRAINYFDALEIQRKISAGEAEGVIDFSNETLARSGVVLIKYYDGAYVNGTITIDGITPLSGVRITVQDYEDPTNPTPHYSTLTDENGWFSVLAPFGKVRIVASIGGLNQRTQTGATILDSALLVITDDQAMRRDIDTDGNGLPDYNIEKNLIVPGVTISGTVFLDTDRSGNKTLGEQEITNSPIIFKHTDLGLERQLTTDSNGVYLMDHTYEGTYTTTVQMRGRSIVASSINVGLTDAFIDVPVNTTRIEGIVKLSDNTSAIGAIIQAYDEIWGHSLTTTTNGNGSYVINAITGNYTISANLGYNTSIPTHVQIIGHEPTTFNMTLVASGTVRGITSIGGLQQGNMFLNFIKVGMGDVSVTTTSDMNGVYSLKLPDAIYDVTAKHYKGGKLYAYIGRTTIRAGSETVYDISFTEGVTLTGQVYAPDESNGINLLNVSFYNGQGVLKARTSLEGIYVAHVPQGDYFVQVSYANLTYLKHHTFMSDKDFTINLQPGMLVQGTIFYDINKSGIPESDEPISSARIAFANSVGSIGEIFTDIEGTYEITLPDTSTYTLTVTKIGYQTLTLGPGTLQNLAPRFTSSLIPLNITVSGRLYLEGAPLLENIEVNIETIGEGGVSTSVFTNNQGRYSVNIAPGNYEITVDQPINPGEEDFRYQTSRIISLNISVGDSSVKKDLQLYARASISGLVQIGLSPVNTYMTFQGPEMTEITTDRGEFTVMLARGVYTLYSNYNKTGTIYATFETLTITEPTYLWINLTKATKVQGNLLYGGSQLLEVVPVTIISDNDATYSQLTSSEGAYSADLIPGNYTVTVDHSSTVTIDTVKRYVRYTHVSSLYVAPNQGYVRHDLTLDRILDNSTLTGKITYNDLPVAAILEFRPLGVDGINKTTGVASNGEYTIKLTPGIYVMYIHDPGTHCVYLQNIEVEPLQTTYMNLSLGKGLKVSGVTTYLTNIRIPSKLDFTDISWVVYTDNTGYFETYLPTGNYVIQVITTLEEHGMSVDYNTTITRDIESDTIINPHLERVPRHGIYLSVDLTRENTVVKNVTAGEIVKYWIKVWNSGNMPDMFQLQGATTGWDITFDRDQVAIDFGTIDGREVNTTSVQATIRAPFDANIEHPPVIVSAFAVNETTTRSTLTLNVQVDRTRGISLKVADVNPTYDGRFLNYTLEIANTGNGNERVGICLPLAEDTKSLGWDPQISVNDTTSGRDIIEDIIIAANSTMRVTIVMNNLGGGEGITTKVRAYLQDSIGYESILMLSTLLPKLEIQGRIAIAGVNIERQETINMTLVSITASLGFVAAIYLILVLRDRRKQRR